jgi:hypothetical protein
MNYFPRGGEDLSVHSLMERERFSAHRRADHMNAKLRIGQDVLFVTHNGERYPAKLIRETEPSTWNLVVFNESGSTVQKAIQYSETPTPNHFCLAEEHQQSRGASSAR